MRRRGDSCSDDSEERACDCDVAVNCVGGAHCFVFAFSGEMKMMIDRHKRFEAFDLLKHASVYINHSKNKLCVTTCRTAANLAPGNSATESSIQFFTCLSFLNEWFMKMQNALDINL